MTVELFTAITTAFTVVISPVQVEHHPNATQVVVRELREMKVSRSQERCAIKIGWLESRNRDGLTNPTSGAYGYFQLMWAEKGWSLEKQTKAAHRYMESRYGTWCAALQHHRQRGWW